MECIYSLNIGPGSIGLMVKLVVYIANQFKFTEDFHTVLQKVESDRISTTS